MNGRDYVALQRLSTIDDKTLVEPGKRCQRVPASSLPGLLALGVIAYRPVQTSAPQSEEA